MNGTDKVLIYTCSGSCMLEFYGLTDTVLFEIILQKIFNSLYEMYNRLIHNRRRKYEAVELRPCIMFLLFISGDVALNPGPTRSQCGTCRRAVASNHIAVYCEVCQLWWYIKCRKHITMTMMVFTFFYSFSMIVATSLTKVFLKTMTTI